MCFDTIDPESGTIHTLTLLFHFLNKKDILNSNTFLGNYCCIINQILSSSNKRQYLALLKSKPKNKQSEKKSNEVCIMLLFDPGLPYTCRVLRIHTKTRLTPKKKKSIVSHFLSATRYHRVSDSPPVRSNTEIYKRIRAYTTHHTLVSDVACR